VSLRLWTDYLDNGEIDSAAASISFGQEQTVRAVALLCRGATANGIVSHLPGRMLAPLGMAGAL
jgi:hypothetical protein